MTEVDTAGTETVRVLCELWGEHFGHAVAPHDDFYELGGDSLGMIDIVGRARALGLPVRSSLALRHPSPARLAQALTAEVPRPQPIVTSGTGTALYVIHSGADRAVIESWHSPRPVKGFPLPAGTETLLAALRRDQPSGPYYLAGLGDGAAPARELARRLRALGDRVALLALIDPPDTDPSNDPGNDPGDLVLLGADGDATLMRKALHR